MFAEQYKRDEGGFILFPADQKRRKELFIDEVSKHPAKANLWLVEELIKHTSKPGNTVVDIMAGSGTILVGALLDRRVVCIDLNPLYVEWQGMSALKMGLDAGKVIILQGDCRKILPIPCQSIIFSPPYSQLMDKGGGIFRREKGLQESYTGYQSDPKNLGNLNDFLFNQAMQEVYKLCAESLPLGGYMSIIIKDRLKGGKREPLGYRCVQSVLKQPFVLDEWYKWKTPGTQFRHIHKAKGDEVIEDEHILIFRKRQQ